MLVEGWKKQENQFEDYQFRSGTPGPTTPSAGESAGACFNRFFTDEVWDLLMQETNRFAGQVRASVTSPTFRPWHDVDREEICRHNDGYVSCHGWRCVGHSSTAHAGAEESDAISEVQANLEVPAPQ